MPEEKKIENNIAAYRSSYKKENDQIIITRFFQVKRDIIDVKTPYTKAQKVIEIMRADEGAQIVLD